MRKPRIVEPSTSAPVPTARKPCVLGGRPPERYEKRDSPAIGALLSWIDVERVLEGDSDRRHATRNLLIFKLHYIDGFTASELAAFPGFSLSVSGIEAVLSRMRKRLRR